MPMLWSQSASRQSCQPMKHTGDGKYRGDHEHRKHNALLNGKIAIGDYLTR
ncbi:MAG: hypothetical protein U1E91_02385 [Moraxella sp.]